MREEWESETTLAKFKVDVILGLSREISQVWGCSEFTKLRSSYLDHGFFLIILFFFGGGVFEIYPRVPCLLSTQFAIGLYLHDWGMVSNSLSH